MTIRDLRTELQTLIDLGISLDLVLADVDPASLDGLDLAGARLELTAVRKQLDRIAGRLVNKAEPKSLAAASG